MALKGSAHPNWKGARVSYSALHDWLRRNYGTPRRCSICLTDKAKLFDWANKTGVYRRARKNWIRLCRGCHRKFDIDSQTLCYAKLAGERLSLKDWSERKGLKYNTLWVRIYKYGWPVKRALGADAQ